MDNADRGPALTLGSTGEKAAAAAIKHPSQERQLPTPARTQSPVAPAQLAPCGKELRGQGELPDLLRGSFCHIAPLLPPVSWLSALLRLCPLVGVFTYHTT